MTNIGDLIKTPGGLEGIVVGTSVTLYRGFRIRAKFEGEVFETEVPRSGLWIMERGHVDTGDDIED